MRYFDLEKIEQDKEMLSDSEMEVRSNISHDPRGDIYNNLDLEEALKTLSKKQRECFELVMRDGCTIREAASALGISGNAVHIYIGRAKRKLKKFLGGV